MSPKPRRTIWEKMLTPVAARTSSTPPPSKEQKLAEENWRLQKENEHLLARIAYYNSAVRSIVLRLKVLDIAELRKEMGPDGTIPMRMMVSELAGLQEAYDDKLNSPYASDSYSVTPSVMVGRYGDPDDHF